MRRRGMTRGDILGGLVAGFIVATAIVTTAVVVTVVNRPLPPPPVAQAPLLGLPDDFREVAVAAQAEFPEPFSVGEDQDNADKRVCLFELAPDLHPGPQGFTDCTAWGGSTALYVRQCVLVRRDGQTGKVIYPNQALMFGLTRFVRKRPACGVPGSYPTDFIAAIKDFGFASSEEIGKPYSGSLAKQLGCSGPTKDMLRAAKLHAGADAYPIRSTAQWRDAICNGYPLTVAIPWKPGRPYKKNDRWYIGFDGPSEGGHQLCSLGYDKGDLMLYNSHGANWPSGVKHSDSTPPGGIWLERKWSEWCKDNGELWAINSVPGFTPDRLDPSIFDKLSSAVPSVSK